MPSSSLPGRDLIGVGNLAAAAHAAGNHGRKTCALSAGNIVERHRAGVRVDDMIDATSRAARCAPTRLVEHADPVAEHVDHRGQRPDRRRVDEILVRRRELQPQARAGGDAYALSRRCTRALRPAAIVAPRFTGDEGGVRASQVEDMRRSVGCLVHRVSAGGVRRSDTAHVQRPSEPDGRRFLVGQEWLRVQEVRAPPNLARVVALNREVESSLARKRQVDLRDAQVACEVVDRFTRQMRFHDPVLQLGKAIELVHYVAGSPRAPAHSDHRDARQEQGRQTLHHPSSSNRSHGLLQSSIWHDSVQLLRCWQLQAVFLQRQLHIARCAGSVVQPFKHVLRSVVHFLQALTIVFFMHRRFTHPNPGLQLPSGMQQP